MADVTPTLDVRNYIIQQAPKYGIDPNVALRVGLSEASNVFDYTKPDRGGDGGSSFGPFQLHYGGLNPAMPHPGLGDDFTAQTGLDARNPSTWRQQIDFALNHAAQNGWGAWMGAKNSGIGNFDGIGGRPAGSTATYNASIASAPPSNGPLVVPPVPSATLVAGNGQSQPQATAANPGANPVSLAIGKLFAGQQAQEQQQNKLAQNQIAQLQPVTGTIHDPFTGLQGYTPQQASANIAPPAAPAPKVIDPFSGLNTQQAQPITADQATSAYMHPAAPNSSVATLSPELRARLEPGDIQNYNTAANDARINAAAPTAPYGLGTAAAFGQGMASGMENVTLGGMQLAGKGLQAAGATNAGGAILGNVNQGLAQDQAQLAPYRAASPVATGLGQLGGAIAATGPLAAGSAPASLLGAIGRGVLTGGLTGAFTTPVDPNSQNYWGDKAWQAGLGAVGGGVLGGIGHGIGMAISGLQPTQAAQTLMREGVPLTPGRAIGGNIAATEAMAKSIPIMGGGIANADMRALEGYNAATYNKVLAPIGEAFDSTAAHVGNDGVSQVKGKIQQVYDAVLPQMQFVPDQQFLQDARAAAALTTKLPPDQQQAFQRIVGDEMTKLNPNGTMDGATLKGVQSELSRISDGYASDPSFNNRELGNAIGAFRNSLMEAAQRSSPPDAAQQLKAADTAWAMYTRLRTAAASQGAMNNGGVITAAQLQNAVRAGDSSVGKGSVATGDALLQDWSKAGQQVLGSKYPDSGTAGRLGLMALATGGAGYAQPVLTAAALGLGRMAYSPQGQRAINTVLFSRPQMLQALGQNTQRATGLISPGLLNTSLVTRTPQE